MDTRPKSPTELALFNFLCMAHEHRRTVVPMLRDAIGHRIERQHWPKINLLMTPSGWMRYMPEMLDEAATYGIHRLVIGKGRASISQPYIDSIIAQDERHADISRHHERFLMRWNTLLHHTCQRCGAGGEYVRPRIHPHNTILCPLCSAQVTSRFLITAMEKIAHKSHLVALSDLAVIQPMILMWMMGTQRDIIEGEGVDDDFISSKNLIEFLDFFKKKNEQLNERVENHG